MEEIHRVTLFNNTSTKMLIITNIGNMSNYAGRVRLWLVNTMRNNYTSVPMLHINMYTHVNMLDIYCETNACTCMKKVKLLSILERN